MEDQSKHEPIIIRITNGGCYLELPAEPFLGDIHEAIALLEDFLYLLQRKQARLLGHVPNRCVLLGDDGADLV